MSSSPEFENFLLFSCPFIPVKQTLETGSCFINVNSQPFPFCSTLFYAKRRAGVHPTSCLSNLYATLVAKKRMTQEQQGVLV